MEHSMKLLIFSFSLLLSINLFASEAATVIALKGKVLKYSSDKGDSKIAVGDIISVGERIKTESGSFVKLKFIDESQTTLGPSSELLVEAFSSDKPGILNLMRGSLKSKVTKDYMNIKKDSSKLFIKSHSASMGVRGTEFIWSYEDEQTGLVTLEGVVRFVSLRDAKERGSLDPEYLDSLLNSKRAVTVSRGETSMLFKSAKEVHKTEKLPEESLKELKKLNFEVSGAGAPKKMSKFFAQNKQNLKNENLDTTDDLFGDSPVEEEVVAESKDKEDKRKIDHERDVTKQKKDNGENSVAADLEQASTNAPETFAFPLAEELVTDKPETERELKPHDSRKALNGEVDEKMAKLEEIKAKLAEKEKLDAEKLVKIGEREKLKKAKSEAIKKLMAKKAKEKDGILGRNEKTMMNKGLGANNLIRKEVNVDDSLIKKLGASTFKASLNGEVSPDMFQADTKTLIDKNNAIIDSALKTESTLIKSVDTALVTQPEVEQPEVDENPTSTTTTSTSSDSSSGTSSTGLVTKIVTGIVKTVSGTSSTGTRDPASDSGADGVSKEDADAAQAAYDKCITDYKAKHKLALDAPVSAFMARQKDAVAYCTEQQAASSTK